MIAVDLFAGGGGASEGIRLALGRSPVLAVNHDAHAIRMHAENHPETIHRHEPVDDVAPALAMRGQTVDLLWASPDCCHFSKARGGKPREQGIRSLAWVVVDWARIVRPVVICLENVAEFLTWGPLDADGHPLPERWGETFQQFVGALAGLGYRVEWRVLNAADYGAPTARKRLFLVARCDGLAPRWPAPTHGPGRASPHRTAAEIIDWSIPIPSIFGRKRPLKEKTEQRIAEGIRRYVVGERAPFLLTLAHGGRLEPLNAPLRTTTTAHRGERAIVAPSLIRIGNGERAGQRPRCEDIEAPLTTITAQGQKQALCAAFLAKHYGGVVGHGVERPLGTITGIDHHSLVAAHLIKHYGTSHSADVRAPSPTITGQGQHIGLVSSFMIKYYGAGGQWQRVDEPLHTMTGKARFGVVTVMIDGEPWAIVDIGMRMLQPRELANAQGFGPEYILNGTKEQQVARIGNSVCPPVARALVAAQFEGIERPSPMLFSAMRGEA